MHSLLMNKPIFILKFRLMLFMKEWIFLQDFLLIHYYQKKALMPK